MAQIALSRRAQADLDRLFEFVVAGDAGAADESIRAILEAIEVLKRHPFIGRLAGDELRELVISRGKSGYIALYEYLRAYDLVRILAIRHQREAGYAG